LIEKLTELGVTHFTPLRTKRSVVHPRETKLARLERYVVEACKQSGRNTLLQVNPLQDWEDYCQRAEPDLRIVAHPGPKGPAWPSGCDVAIGVGPEGGFTEEEIAIAMSHGWQGMNLGPRILRIETAAIVLAAWATI
jgi:16S rRNA (uracil1498-N3)-methyltransferase